MKKILGIAFLFAFFVHSAYATEDTGTLKDNLRPDIKNAENKSSVSAPPVDTTVKNVPETLKVNNNPFVLSDKVFNYAVLNVISDKTMPDEIIYKEMQREFYALDPQRQGNGISYYPGLRGPNQLIVYTPVYGLRTGTNEFGTEAIVENNMVVRLNGADSVIPKNGFVISGHGNAKNWIKQNIQVGSKVYIDAENKNIKVYLTPSSLIFAAKEKLSEANSLIEYYKRIDILYNEKKAGEYLEEAKDCLRKAERKPEKTQNYITKAMESLNYALKNTIPYYENELKGIWVRPVETSPDEIVKTVERINSSGITDIFLETYFHGKTIYPSEYLKKSGVIYQRKEFDGFDPLKIWIEEAHKRNMKVHVWFESFYAGNDNPSTTPEHVLNLHPDWANRRLINYDNEEPQPSLSEHNGYFLDPSNPSVQEYLLGIISEIITNYKPDGINLDYIRYPQTVEANNTSYVPTSWGYTPFAREEFKSLYNIDPVDIKYGTGEWELWSLYRQNKIAEFIQNVKKITQNSSILLTAVVFPDLNKSIQTKMQNWRMWSVNNYVDGITPLILTCDKNTSDLLIRDVIKNTSQTTKIYPGLFVPFMNGAFEDLLVQIQKTRVYKTNGAIFFDYAHFNDDYKDAVSTRVYNKNYEQREFKLRTPQNYKPQVNMPDKKKKKNKRKEKRNRRNEDDNN